MSADPSPATLIPAAYDGRFRTHATVLESPEHGPQLCHSVEESYPPQCGGPDIVGWDWSAVEAESANGTTWGAYTIVGTWDGQTFTLTEPAAPGDPPPFVGPDFSTPCPTPADGWVPVNPALATEQAFQQAIQLAQAAPGFGGLWIDQQTTGDELGNNDPTRFILNVTTTGDQARLEADLREVWGGSLCVSAAVRDEASLLAMQEDLSSRPDILGSSTDILSGQLVVQVYAATAELQRDLNEEFGAGTVRLEALLEPID